MLRGAGRDILPLLVRADELNLVWVFIKRDVVLKMACPV